MSSVLGGRNVHARVSVCVTVCVSTCVCACVLDILLYEEQVEGHIGCQWQYWVLSLGGPDPLSSPPGGQYTVTTSPGCPPGKAASGEALLTAAFTLKAN